jgi:hypothetical protein
MSFERGWQALNLEMPDRIPHTEYVSNPAWVKRLTGLDLRDPEQAAEARIALVREWDYDLRWYNMAHPSQPRMTHMGTAVWSEDYEVTDNRACPFTDVQDVLDFDPIGELPVPPHGELVEYFTETWERGQRETPTAVVPGGYYNTIFSWCILTFGWEMFLTAAALDEDRFDAVLEGFCEISLASYRAQAECGCKAFICHDDIVWTEGPVFHPEWYREHVFPRYERLWEPLKDAGIKILFCSDGDYTDFIDDLVDAGADGFIFEPMTDLRYVVENYGQDKVIVGNIDCRVLTFGDEEAIRAEVERCASLGRDCPGYFFAVGNHLPYNVPVDAIEVYADAIEELGERD